jgi:hypothetical protein
LAAAVNWARNLSKDPNWSSMAAARSPSGLSPPLGDRFFHQMLWLTCPPRWNARFFSLRKIAD